MFLRHPERDALLFIRRRTEPFLGLWGLPGGRMRVGEHPSRAASREITEETSLEPRDLKITAVVSEVFRQGGEAAFQTILFLAEAEAANADFESRDEGELCWFDLDEIPGREKDVIPTDFVFVRDIYRKAAGGVYRSDMLADDGYRLESFGPEK